MRSASTHVLSLDFTKVGDALVDFLKEAAVVSGIGDEEVKGGVSSRGRSVRWAGSAEDRHC